MNDRLLMKSFERRKNGENDLRGFLRGKRAAADALGERFAFDEFHHQDRPLLVFHNVVDAAGIGMGDLRRGSRLLPEALAARRVRIELANHF